MTSQSATSASMSRVTPEAVGLPSAAVERFLDAIDRAGVELHSMMLLRHGKVLAEGWWAPFQPDGLHLVYSLSKSFTATAIGLAIGEGLLSLDDLAISFFAEIDPATVDPNIGRTRVRDLLSMASGHREDTIDRLRFSTETDLISSFFAIAAEEVPGTWFTYNQGCTLTLSAIITRLTGLRLIDYLRPRLFHPLGIETAYWSSVGTIDFGFSGLHVCTDAVARLGQLYLDDGLWQGQRLLPEGWVAEATAHQVDNPREPQIDWRQGYGFQFWRCQNDGYRGDGAYGQFCVVLPEQDAVIALTGATEDMQSVLDAVWSELLPAYGEVRPADDGALGALHDRLSGLAIPVAAGTAHPGSAGPWRASSPDGHSPIAAISITEGPDGSWLLTIDESCRFEIPCGQGKWLTKEQTLPGDGQLVTAASGGWIDAETFEAEVFAVQTPHRLTLRCSFESGVGTLHAGWVTIPLGAPNQLSQLALCPAGIGIESSLIELDFGSVSQPNQPSGDAEPTINFEAAEQHYGYEPTTELNGVAYQAMPPVQMPIQPSFGYQQPYPPAPVAGPQKSRLAAGLFAIFLGTLGIHNFYLGRTGRAIAQLLITVLSLGVLAVVTSVWAIIEGILILTRSENYLTDAKGIPLTD